MNDNQKKALDNVIQTYRGGEHKLAGARASELIYGASNKPNQAILDELLKEEPGFSDFISAPVSGTVIDTVQDKGQEPLQTPANLSSEEAKQEQNAVDKTLAPGREARDAKSDIDKDSVGSAQLNPPENLPPFGGKGDHDGVGGPGGSKYRKPKA